VVTRRHLTGIAALLTAVFALFVVPAQAGALDEQATYADHGAAAAQTLLQVWYDGGRWRMCSHTGCPTQNQDWGADSLTYTLYLRWRTTHDPALEQYFIALLSAAPTYGPPCTTTTCKQWSDVPEWDALADLREYSATGHDPLALTKARAAYNAVASNAYALGACPSVLYQQPFGGDNKLKTLETDSNAILAALLLYDDTKNTAYLHDAVTLYRAARTYFLDPDLPLYSVYVFDDGQHCRQLRHRFFASVNGNMIQAGIALYAATRDSRYEQQAIATAKAVDRQLSDGRGVFANLQAENDVAEPLVEAMYALATQEHQPFARRWLLRNAAAAVDARAGDGSFGRFFDGPAPPGAVTAWQTNGGFALMIVAAALAPDRITAEYQWRGAQQVVTDVHSLPTTIRFRGSSIALIGTIGEECCEAGHARIFIDGQETTDFSGIWQNKSCSGAAVQDVVLFAWQWPRSGIHEVRLDLGTDNPKEGGSYVHVRGYLLK
jgi:hypothetical protein